MKNKLEILKTKHLDALASYREGLYKAPQLRQLFLEFTLRCNEHCKHCGSSCGDVPCPEISLDDYKKILDKVKKDFGTKGLMLCITGGEPLLRKDFFDIMNYAHDLGFSWGMTSNATLITKEIAKKLYESGMKTISVSIDGLEKTHDEFRNRKGAYKAAMDGIQNLINQGGFSAIQITTVITHENIKELDAMYETFKDIDIDSWRVVGIEPMGRAKSHPELLLTKEDQIRLLDFVKSKREEQMPVQYGCSHYLGLKYEREVRDWYFICSAGRYVASIMSNGDIAACLDIDRNEKTIQGNIYKDDFTDVWYNKFKIFRSSLAERNETCRNCRHKKYCDGDSFHSWDFEKDEPLVCMKDVLFK